MILQGTTGTLAGADLGILEWWSCNDNAHKNFKPRPFN